MRERERSGLTGRGRGGPLLCLYRYLIYPSTHPVTTQQPTTSQLGLDRLRREKIPYHITAPFTPL